MGPCVHGKEQMAVGRDHRRIVRPVCKYDESDRTESRAGDPTPRYDWVTPSVRVVVVVEKKLRSSGEVGGRVER